VEYRPEIELHEHKLTVLYRKALQDQVMPHLHSSLKQAGVQATLIEGGAGAVMCHSASCIGGRRCDFWCNLVPDAGADDHITHCWLARI
jgi:hypothetical protein